MTDTQALDIENMSYVEFTALTKEDRAKLSLEELQQLHDRMRRFTHAMNLNTESTQRNGQKFMEFQEKIIKTWLTIGAGGLVATLALMGQLFGANSELALWLVIPCLFFVITILMSIARMLRVQKRYYQELLILSDEYEKETGKSMLSNLPSNSRGKPDVISMWHWLPMSFYSGVLMIVGLFIYQIVDQLLQSGS